MIDTHTHIYLSEEFSDGREAVVERALSAGVDRMIFPNIDLKSVEPMKWLHDRFPESTSITLGLHPTEVDADWKSALRDIERAMKDDEIVGIGEVGIDLHWDSTYIRQQQEAFQWQLSMARERELPVIIHCRDAMDVTLQCIDSLGGELSQLLFHSFTGSADDAKEIMKRYPAMFGINGVATFKNADDVRKAICEIGAEKIVLETDSPYLAPVPYRGKRNESAYIMSTLKSVAETLEIEPKELEKITDENARRIFRLS